MGNSQVHCISRARRPSLDKERYDSLCAIGDIIRHIEVDISQYAPDILIVSKALRKLLAREANRVKPSC